MSWYVNYFHFYQTDPACCNAGAFAIQLLDRGRPGGNRTPDTAGKSRLLWPLSYRSIVVIWVRIELTLTEGKSLPLSLSATRSWCPRQDSNLHTSRIATEHSSS